jgi:hypothetical protein
LGFASSPPAIAGALHPNGQKFPHFALTWHNSSTTNLLPFIMMEARIQEALEYLSLFPGTTLSKAARKFEIPRTTLSNQSKNAQPKKKRAATHVLLAAHVCSGAASGNSVCALALGRT